MVVPDKMTKEAMFCSDFEETVWCAKGFADRLEFHLISGNHWLCGVGQVGSLQSVFLICKNGDRIAMRVCVCVCVCVCVMINRKECTK